MEPGVKRAIWILAFHGCATTRPAPLSSHHRGDGHATVRPGHLVRPHRHDHGRVTPPRIRGGGSGLNGRSSPAACRELPRIDTRLSTESGVTGIWSSAAASVLSAMALRRDDDSGVRGGRERASPACATLPTSPVRSVTLGSWKVNYLGDRTVPRSALAWNEQRSGNHARSAG
jgi:hypothetical protein